MTDTGVGARCTRLLDRLRSDRGGSGGVEGVGFRPLWIQSLSRRHPLNRGCETNLRVLYSRSNNRGRVLCGPGRVRF